MMSILNWRGTLGLLIAAVTVKDMAPSGLAAKPYSDDTADSS